MRTLTWILGLFGAAACVFGVGFHVALGLADQPITLVLACVFGVLMGVLGALVSAREPRNSIGWLMCLASLSTALFTLPTDYAYDALVLRHGALPAGEPMLWFGSWAAIPLFGLILPLILARFPSGRPRPRWWFADWVAITGTLAFASAVALGSAPLPLAAPRILVLLTPYANNPVGVEIPGDVGVYMWMSGLGLIILAYVLSAGALVSRFRSATHEDAIKLKWFAYAGTLIALAIVYSGIAWYRSGDLLTALIPFEATLWTLPVAIGIAILRYRLFDIDLIINRTIVYVSLTAILAAGYTAGITFLQRLFISWSGQKSDAAYVLTAFGIVVGFSPLKDWLQRQVDRRVGRVRAAAALDQFSAGVDAVVSVMDVHRIACRFLDEAIVAFDAGGAALYLQSEKPIYNRGQLNGDPCLEVPIRHGRRHLGRLVLAERRGHYHYAERDREALQRSADSVGEAVALAAHYGHRPFPPGRTGVMTRPVQQSLSESSSPAE